MPDHSKANCLSMTHLSRQPTRARIFRQTYSKRTNN